MENFNKIKEEIKTQLDSAKYCGDLSDIGNEIGIILGKYLMTNDELDDFIHGVNHGISLTNGTHDQIDIKENKYDKSLRLLDEYLNSGESIVFFKKMRKKKEIQQNRYKHFEEWLKHNDFDLLISRLISEHDEKYRKKCYNNGFQPEPNNKLTFLLDYIIEKFKPIKIKHLHDSVFSNKIWEFRGYYFQLIWGQGVLTKIYDKTDLKFLLQI